MRCTLWEWAQVQTQRQQKQSIHFQMNLFISLHFRGEMHRCQFNWGPKSEHCSEVRIPTRIHAMPTVIFIIFCRLKTIGKQFMYSWSCVFSKMKMQSTSHIPAMDPMMWLLLNLYNQSHRHRSHQQTRSYQRIQPVRSYEIDLYRIKRNNFDNN